MNEKNAILSLWNKIIKLIDEKFSHAYYDKTFPSTVFKVNGDGTYKIAREGNLYDVTCGLGIELKAGQSVWVTIPCGIKNIKDMYISGIKGNKKIRREDDING